MEIWNWILRFEILESENTQFENSKFEHSEFENLEFENSRKDQIIVFQRNITFLGKANASNFDANYRSILLPTILRTSKDINETTKLECRFDLALLTYYTLK